MTAKPLGCGVLNPADLAAGESMTDRTGFDFLLPLPRRATLIQQPIVD
jgi:hypothetical protein